MIGKKWSGGAEKPVLVTGQIKSSFVLDETRDASRLRPSFYAGYGSGGDTSICRLAIGDRDRGRSKDGGGGRGKKCTSETPKPEFFVRSPIRQEKFYDEGGSIRWTTFVGSRLNWIFAFVRRVDEHGYGIAG